MLARVALLGLAALASPSGCDQAFGDGRQDAHQPGENLGTFQVTGTQTANTCGAGAFGEQSSWQFQVKLARATGEIFWNNGQEILAGTLASDGLTFSFDTGVVIDMRAADQVGLPACSIRRADHASGTLGADATTFTGELSYQFSPTAGSSCTDIVSGATPLAATLPCSFSFHLTAQRTVAP